MNYEAIRTVTEQIERLQKALSILTTPFPTETRFEARMVTHCAFSPLSFNPCIPGMPKQRCCKPGECELGLNTKPKHEHKFVYEFNREFPDGVIEEWHECSCGRTRITETTTEKHNTHSGQ